MREGEIGGLVLVAGGEEDMFGVAWLIWEGGLRVVGMGFGLGEVLWLRLCMCWASR